jgi:hypothetical protein
MTATVDNAVADLQRANVQLQRQLDEALARESAIAEVLQVINSSPGHLVPVFDAILEKATVLGDAAFGLMCSYDGELFHPVCWRGDFPAEVAKHLRRPIARRPGGRSTALCRTTRGCTSPPMLRRSLPTRLIAQAASAEHHLSNWPAGALGFGCRCAKRKNPATTAKASSVGGFRKARNAAQPVGTFASMNRSGREQRRRLAERH